MRASPDIRESLKEPSVSNRDLLILRLSSDISLIGD